MIFLGCGQSLIICNAHGHALHFKTWLKNPRHFIKSPCLHLFVTWYFNAYGDPFCNNHVRELPEQIYECLFLSRTENWAPAIKVLDFSTVIDEFQCHFARNHMRSISLTILSLTWNVKTKKSGSTYLVLGTFGPFGLNFYFLEFDIYIML